MFLLRTQLLQVCEGGVGSGRFGPFCGVAPGPPVFGGVFLVALMMAVLINTLSKTRFSTDTLLRVLANGALARGPVAVAVLTGRPVDGEAYLFGEVLSVKVGEQGSVRDGVPTVLGQLIKRLLWPCWQALEPRSSGRC